MVDEIESGRRRDRAAREHHFDGAPRDQPTGKPASSDSWTAERMGLWTWITGVEK